MSSDSAERYRKVAAGFTLRAEAVPDVRWSRPAPCDGWLAADVVRHLVEWVPPFLDVGTGITLHPGPSVEADPVGAWSAMSDQVQALLDAPDRSRTVFDHPAVGRHRLDDAVTEFVLPDVLIHTWDLARATGLDETLDADEVQRMFLRVQDLDDVLRASGQFGPKVTAPDGADEQTRLLAFLGRHP